MARITVIGKSGCHLCEEAELVVTRVCERTGADWERRSITDDADLEQRYRDQIPVILVDGQMHTYWRVEEEALVAALAGRRRWGLRRAH